MNEKVGGSDKSITGMIQFRQAVDDCDLVDLGFSGPKLTWNNIREGVDNIQERLERFLTDVLWRDRFQRFCVEHMGFNSLDHRPILLKGSPVVRGQHGLSRMF